MKDQDETKLIETLGLNVPPTVEEIEEAIEMTAVFADIKSKRSKK